MGNNLNYRVFPHEASHKTVTLSERERNDIRGLSEDMEWVVGVGSCIFIAIFSISIFGFCFGAVLAVAGATITFVLISSSVKNSNVSDMERKKTAEANQSEVSRVRSEAESLTSSLIYTHKSSAELADTLPEHLSQASTWLQNARSCQML